MTATLLVAPLLACPTYPPELTVVTLGDGTASTGASESSSSTFTGATTSDGDDSSDAIDADTGDVFFPCGESPQVCLTPSAFEGIGTCDPFIQNCAVDQKCMPFAGDGAPTWTSTACMPLARNPAQLGEPCTVQNGATSGMDSCAKGLMCWEVDASGAGTCIALCGCGPKAPSCVTSGTVCTITNDGVLPVCLPICDPLEQPCAPGQGCYPVVSGTGFVCAPDASGGARPGGSCDFVNGCAPGQVCTAAADVPGCVSAYCCAALCDTAAPRCPDPQTACKPWYAGAQSGACDERLGYCGVQ